MVTNENAIKTWRYKRRCTVTCPVGIILQENNPHLRTARVWRRVQKAELFFIWLDCDRSQMRGSIMSNCFKSYFDLFANHSIDNLTTTAIMNEAYASPETDPCFEEQSKKYTVNIYKICLSNKFRIAGMWRRVSSTMWDVEIWNFSVSDGIFSR